MQTPLEDPRTVLAVSGGDRLDFLQNLVTNDVLQLEHGPVYAALLTPQGKLVADFLLITSGETVLVDVASPLAEGLARRLSMYRLRADVSVEPTAIGVRRGHGEPPPGAVADPRHPALPWRLFGDGADADDATELRVRHAVPLSGVELVPDETYVLEAGFARLNGVDFRKGCYVGQEVTARMHHKTELRKGLARVEIEGAAPIGIGITASGRTVGTLYSQAGGWALAYLRFDRAEAEMTAGEAVLRWSPDQARSA